MKNAIIGGVSRSGKTILACRLSRELGLSHIPLDALVSSFGLVFPELNIHHTKVPYLETCSNLRPFIYQFIKDLEEEPLSFVIDGFHLLPEDVLNECPPERFEILFIGYPSIDRQAKFENLRKFATPGDWTRDISDDDLMALVDEFIERGRFFKSECCRLGLRFLDVSQGFESVIYACVNELSNNLRGEQLV